MLGNTGDFFSNNNLILLICNVRKINQHVGLIELVKYNTDREYSSNHTSCNIYFFICYEFAQEELKETLCHCEPLVSVKEIGQNFTNNLTVLVLLVDLAWHLFDESDKEISCLPCK